MFVCLLINVSREGERSSVRDFSVILDLGDVWHNKKVKVNMNRKREKREKELKKGRCEREIFVNAVVER